MIDVKALRERLELNYGEIELPIYEMRQLLDALEAADELVTTALKAHKELEAGYETCGLIVDMKHQVTKYRAARWN